MLEKRECRGVPGVDCGWWVGCAFSSWKVKDGNMLSLSSNDWMRNLTCI